MLLYTQLVMLIFNSGSRKNGTDIAPSNSTAPSNITVETNATAQIQFYNSTYFMSIRGSPAETLVLEAKAYCAAFGHLSNQFIEKKKQNTTEITGGNSTLNEKETRQNSTEVPAGNFTLNEDKNSTQGNDTSRLWENYKFAPNQTARINYTIVDESRYLVTKRVYNVNAILRYRTLNKWSLRLLRPNEMIATQDHLQKRVQELKNGTHAVEFPALESLFVNQTMTDQLFTNEIDETIKELNPSFEARDILRGSRFEVVGCEEKPGRGEATIILALNGSLPIIPKELEEQYLTAIEQQ